MTDATITTAALDLGGERPAVRRLTRPLSDGNRSFTSFYRTGGTLEHWDDTKSAWPVRYIAEAPTQSTAGSSEEDEEEEPRLVVEEEPNESFWNEWAEELLQTEETEYQKVRQSLSPSQPKEEAEITFYNDPSFSCVQETPDSSFVGAEEDASRSPVLTYPPSLLTGMLSAGGEPEEVEEVENDLLFKQEERNLTVKDDNEEEEEEETPKTMGASRTVHVDLATLCPIPAEEEEDDDRPPTNQDSPFTATRRQMNTSLSTVAAMNISQATIQLPSATLLQQAMDYSNIATDLVQEKDYAAAMEQFQHAIDCYQQSDSSSKSHASKIGGSILTLVNIAGCYRNMGTVSRLQEAFDEAARYLQLAEEYYMKGREAVEIRSSASILTLDGKLLGNDADDESSNLMDTTSPTTANSYSTNADDEAMCLDAMVIETLQSRAHFHIKYQDDREQAVECHEQCLKLLIHLAKNNRWEEDALEEAEAPVREQGVAFVSISKAHHTTLLVKSLESLGDLYRSLAAGSNDASSLALFEDALDILQCRMDEPAQDDDALIQSVSLILRYLSEIYFSRHALDQAVDALHDSTAIKLTRSGPPCPEALAVMDQMGAAHEQMEHYDKALSCYEQTLLARCKYYGTTHFCVAQSLVHVARVTERRDGTTSPESVELYKAANAIFALHLCTDRPVPLDHEVEQVLQLIPTVLRQGQYEKAISDLNMCLAMADSPKTTVQFNKAELYLDLGRAYMGMQDYPLATTALTKALQQPGAHEEAIYDLLQRVEFLQREAGENSRIGGGTRMAHLSNVQDPTLSFHDLSLQTERSLYIFQDGAEKRIPSRNPHYDILYQSFVKDAEPTETCATDETARRVDTPHRRKTIKIGQHVAQIMQRIQLSQKMRRLRNFRIPAVFKVCQGKPSVVVVEPSSSSGRYDNLASDPNVDPKEVLAYSSFEMPPPSPWEVALSRLFPHRSGPGRPSLAPHRRSVIIAEEEGGFSCQLA
jgi:tetratricopeptide (TPR) repeat protein